MRRARTRRVLAGLDEVERFGLQACRRATTASAMCWWAVVRRRSCSALAADTVLDGVQLGDAGQCLAGDWGVAAFGNVIELTPEVRPAIGQDHCAAGASRIRQGVVASIAVDLQDAREPGQVAQGNLRTF